ncbi:MAG: hypothetical protein ABI658_26650 [Acidimicrobiales bacterium]
MELVHALLRYAIVKYILLPCVIGTAVYYFAIKAGVGIRWLLMDEDRHDVERRRKKIRIHD